MRNAYRILVIKPEIKGALWRPICHWKDILELTGICWCGLDSNGSCKCGN